MVNIVAERWTPGTCACDFVWEYDADLDDGPRKHMITTIYNVCDEHQEFWSFQNIWYEDYVHGFHLEEQMAYLCVDDIAEYLGLTTTPERIELVMQYVSRMYFDPERVLHVVTTGVSEAHIKNIQKRLETKFGIDNVIVE